MRAPALLGLLLGWAGVRPLRVPDRVPDLSPLPTKFADLQPLRVRSPGSRQRRRRIRDRRAGRVR